MTKRRSRVLMMPDEVWKELIMLRIPLLEIQMYVYIWGKTDRFGKDRERLKLKDFRSGLGIQDKGHAHRIRKGLIDRGMIRVEDSGHKQSPFYSCVKDPSFWKGRPLSQPLKDERSTEKSTLGSTERSTFEKKGRPRSQPFPHARKSNKGSRGVEAEGIKPTLSDLKKIENQIKILEDELKREFGELIPPEDDRTRERDQLKAWVKKEKAKLLRKDRKPKPGSAFDWGPDQVH